MKKITGLVAVAAMSMASASAFAEYLDTRVNDCSALPTHDQLTTALQSALAQSNGALDFDMWATVVNRFGVVCAVTSAEGLGGSPDTDFPDPWLGSRVISAQKANTANLFSTDGFALSTANLHAAVQPGGSLYGLQHSNPVDPRVGYLGSPKQYGTATDPMVGLKPGGVNVFGGGLALYNASGELVGAVGVSGDTSCADHNIAWRTREGLAGLTSANVPAGVGSPKDNIIYDTTDAFGHPFCLGTEPAVNADITNPPA